MPIEPIKIPQNVQIEDRIIGTVTLRQLILVIIGAGISYAIWSNLQKVYGPVGFPLTILAWSPTLVFLAFAFVKVHDLSLMRICFLLLEKSTKPQVRIWAPRSGVTLNPQALLTLSKEKERKRHEQKEVGGIDTLSSTLDLPPPDSSLVPPEKP